MASSGYLHLLVGVTRVLDADGKHARRDAARTLVRPFIDPIDIFVAGLAVLFAARCVAHCPRWPGVLPREIRVAGFLVSQDSGSTVPVLAGDFAPSEVPVMAETLAAESVPSAVRGVSGTAAQRCRESRAHVQNLHR